MNERNIETFNRLSLREQRNFFLLYFGMHYFIKQRKVTKHTKASFEKKIATHSVVNNLRLSFRLEIEDDEISFITYENSTKRICFINRNGNAEFQDIREAKTLVGDELTSILLKAINNTVPFDISEDSILYFHNLIPSNLYYRFILGAGVSNERDYNGVNWSDLEAKFADAIDKRYRKTGLARELADNVFNVNYGIFQVIKDIHNDDYKEIVYNMIVNMKDPDFTDDTMLSAVVDVVEAQLESLSVREQRILTFNYDSLFESLFELKYGSTYFIGHKRNGFINPYKNLVSIYHPHGYLPKKDIIHNTKVFDYYLNSIVLTTEEYVKAYATPSADGYRLLNEQLNETCCFIGNSITDYEEQKVIKEHFDKYPSSFHFAFLKCDNYSDYAVLYKTLFLLKIGIIPLWAKNHDEHKEFLKNVSKRLGL